MADMMNTLSSSSLRCELQVIGAKNVELKHKGSLFVRCYLPAGNNRRIQLETREIIPSKKDAHLIWDDKFSLECNGTEDTVTELEDKNIIVELRWRKAKPFLGKRIGGSQLLGSAEIPWKNIYNAPNREIQIWVPLTVNLTNDHFSSRVLQLDEGVKPPALQLAFKVEVTLPALPVSVEEMKRKRRKQRLHQSEECSCKSYAGLCADAELLFLGVALEAF